MILAPTIEAKADPRAAALLLAAAVAGDLLVGEAVPRSAFRWTPGGTPVVSQKYAPDVDGDLWPLPGTTLKKGAGDCAALVRLYAQVWGTHVGVSGSGGSKLHCVLFEDGVKWDPARDAGMAGTPSDHYVLVPIDRPSSALLQRVQDFAKRLGVQAPDEALERLALGSASPEHLGAVARRLADRADGRSVPARVVELLHAPDSAPGMLRSVGAPAALALLFVLEAVPGLAASLVTRRAAAREEPAELAGLDEVEDIFPGCSGGCQVR